MLHRFIFSAALLILMVDGSVFAVRDAQEFNSAENALVCEQTDLSDDEWLEVCDLHRHGVGHGAKYSLRKIINTILARLHFKIALHAEFALDDMPNGMPTQVYQRLVNHRTVANYLKQQKGKTIPWQSIFSTIRALQLRRPIAQRIDFAADALIMKMLFNQEFNGADGAIVDPETDLTETEWALVKEFNIRVAATMRAEAGAEFSVRKIINIVLIYIGNGIGLSRRYEGRAVHMSLNTLQKYFCSNEQKEAWRNIIRALQHAEGRDGCHAGRVWDTKSPILRLLTLTWDESVIDVRTDVQDVAWEAVRELDIRSRVSGPAQSWRRVLNHVLLLIDRNLAVTRGAWKILEQMGYRNLMSVSSLQKLFKNELLREKWKSVFEALQGADYHHAGAWRASKTLFIRCGFRPVEQAAVQGAVDDAQVVNEREIYAEGADFQEVLDQDEGIGVGVVVPLPGLPIPAGDQDNDDGGELPAPAAEREGGAGLGDFGIDVRSEASGESGLWPLSPAMGVLHHAAFMMSPLLDAAEEAAGAGAQADGEDDFSPNSESYAVSPDSDLSQIEWWKIAPHIGVIRGVSVRKIINSLIFRVLRGYGLSSKHGRKVIDGVPAAELQNYLSTANEIGRGLPAVFDILLRGGLIGGRQRKWPVASQLLFQIYGNDSYKNLIRRR